MAGRRSKPVDQVLGHRSKAEKEARKEAEEKLKTNDNLVNRVPTWLNDEAKKIYKFLIEQFKETGILCNLDKETVAICADAMYRMREAQAMIDEQGLIVDGKENPCIRIYEKYEKIYAKMISELGLSPSARSKMALTQSQTKKEEEDVLLQILRSDNDE